MNVLNKNQLERGYFDIQVAYRGRIRGVISIFSDYQGQEEVCISGSAGWAHWINFLKTNTKALKVLAVWSELNQTVLDAICEQENLEELYLRWGKYSDLSGLKKLKKLKYLYVGPSSRVTTIEPIGHLIDMIAIELNNLKKVEDYSPLANLHKVQQIFLNANDDGKPTTIKDLEFVRWKKELVSFAPNVHLVNRYTSEALKSLGETLPSLMPEHKRMFVFPRFIDEPDDGSEPPMTKKRFWALIEEAKAMAEKSEDYETMLKNWVIKLEEKLAQLEEIEIFHWGHIFQIYMDRSYDGRLIYIAGEIGGGMSDDGFEYFRGWLIAQGREIYTKARRDPKSLLSHDFGEDVVPSLESMSYVASRAFCQKHGLARDDYAGMDRYEEGYYGTALPAKVEKGLLR